MSECVYKQLFASGDYCAYTLEHCNEFEVVNFTQLYFCQANQNWVLLIVFAVKFSTKLQAPVFICYFSLPSSYCRQSFGSILNLYFLVFEYVTNFGWVNNIFTMIRVTLIAFANGAPDALTAVVASSSEEGVLIAVGAIFGAGIFVTTVVLGLVIHVSKKITVLKDAIIRDIVFNMIGTGVIIIYACIGFINQLMSLLYVSLYLVYIFVVLYQERQTRLERDKIQEDYTIQQQDLRKTMQPYSDNDDLFLAMMQNQKQQEDLKNIDQVNETERIGYYKNQALISKPLYLSRILESRGKELDVSQYSQKQDDNNISGMIEKGPVELQWKNMDNYDKVFFVYGYPFEFIRTITIPACCPEQWNKYESMAQCILTPLAVLILIRIVTIKLFGIYVIFFMWLITIPLAIYLYKFTENIQPPKGLIVIVCVGTILSVLWAKLCVEVMIDFLSLVQVLTGISYAYIGMTFLAMGNSLGDCLVNIQVARMGYGLMALTGCFSGVIFNLLVGFGLALVRLTWFGNYNGTIKFNLFRDSDEQPNDQGSYDRFMNVRLNNTIAYTLILFALINMCMSLVIINVKKQKVIQDYSFRLRSQVAKYYFTFYVIFLVLITFISFSLEATIKYLRPGTF